MTVFFADRILATWGDEVRSRFQRESGGMLLGYETVSGQAVITSATRPGPNARLGLFSFEPDHEWDRCLLAEAYEGSGRIIRYLGEWHSHSFGWLRPSPSDGRTIRKIAAHSDARMEYPFSAIVSRGRDGTLVWALYRLDKKARLVPVMAKVGPYHYGQLPDRPSRP